MGSNTKLLFIIFLFISFFVNCSSSCSNNDSNSSNNNNQNSEQNVKNTNINLNQSNKNQNINNSNQINPDNNNNLENQVNNFKNPESCIEPSDYSGSENLIWKRENGYLNRPFCSSNNIHPVYGEIVQLILDEDACSGKDGCILPEMVQDSADGIVTTKVTATVKRLIIEETDANDGTLIVSITILDQSDTYEVGRLDIGDAETRIKAHIPSDVIIGKKLTFINRYINKIADGIIRFSSAFIQDPNSNKIVFGSVAKDNTDNLGLFYTDLLPFTYSAVFKEEETANVCDGSDDTFIYLRQLECSKIELGDLIIETDNNKFIIPAECEGDIQVGNDNYGVVLANIIRYTKNTCQPEETYNYTSANFYFFDRSYFIKNPDYTPLHPQCNELE